METKQIKVYRIVDSDVENAQELLMSMEEYKKIKVEKGISHVFALESEFEALKIEAADNKSLKEENEELKKQLLELKNGKKVGRKPKTETKPTETK